MKLFGPPTILEPLVITTEECSELYRRRAYIYKTYLNQRHPEQYLLQTYPNLLLIYKGRTNKIELNTIISIPMIIHGSVTNDEINVYCNGVKFTIDGEQHSNMLAFETVRQSMVDLSIQVGDQDV